MPATPPFDSPPCHLLSLPPELREQIYHHVFARESDYCDTIQVSHDCEIILTSRNRPNPYIERLEDPDYVDDNEPKDDVALLRTCKQIYHEALPILYDCSRFLITIRGGLDSHTGSYQLRETEGLEMFSRMRFVKIVVEMQFALEDPNLLENVETVAKALKGNKRLQVSCIKFVFPAEDGPMKRCRRGIKIKGTGNQILKAIQGIKTEIPPKIVVEPLESEAVSAEVLDDFVNGVGGMDWSRQYKYDLDTPPRKCRRVAQTKCCRRGVVRGPTRSEPRWSIMPDGKPGGRF